jgi:hypothetical protein
MRAGIVVAAWPPASQSSGYSTRHRRNDTDRRHLPGNAWTPTHR